MADGMIKTLLIALAVLYLLGGLGLFVFSKKMYRKKSGNTLVKYLVYLIIVLVHMFLIRYSLTIYRILSFLYLAIGLYEINSTLHLITWRFINSVFVFLLFMLIGTGFSFFLFLPAVEILFLFLVVSAFDGFSQVTGYVFGKRKLASKVSPNKTVEGLAGGLIFSLVPAIIIGFYSNMSVTDLTVRFCVIIPAAFAGDFLSSLIKRKAGIKDFSALIPGHGGILDRFDSHFMAGSVYWIFTVCNLV